MKECCEGQGDGIIPRAIRQLELFTTIRNLTIATIKNAKPCTTAAAASEGLFTFERRRFGLKIVELTKGGPHQRVWGRRKPARSSPASSVRRPPLTWSPISAGFWRKATENATANTPPRHLKKSDLVSQYDTGSRDTRTGIAPRAGTRRGTLTPAGDDKKKDC